MQIRTVVMMVAAACAIGVSTGCVKQEDLDALEAKKNEEISALTADHQEALDARDVEIQTLSTANADLDDQISTLKAEKTDLSDNVSSLESDVSSLNSQVRTLNRDLEDAVASAASSKAKADSMVSALDEAERLAAFHEKQYNSMRAAFIKQQQVNPAQYQVDLGSASNLDVDSAAIFGDIVAAAAVNQPSGASVEPAASGDDVIKGLLKDMGNM